VRVGKARGPGRERGPPFRVLEVRGGQVALERALQQRRWEFRSGGPFDAALFELVLPIVGVWELEDGGRISIVRHLGKLVYVDSKWQHAGALVSPQDAHWPQAPAGFPALFAALLSEGRTVWLRWEQAHELRLCYTYGHPAGARWLHRTAFRRLRSGDEEVRIAFLLLQCFHSVADGHCYTPLAGDLLDLYHSHAEGRAAELHLPAVGEAFAVLEQRLFDTLHFHSERPDRHSLRGGIWSFYARGYDYTVTFQSGAATVLSWAAARYALPMDYLLLALVVVAIARASALETVELTMYVPMRDGFEAAAVGLFADWRDVAVATASADATLIGVVLQVADLLRLRRWSVFNALRKPERTVVNFHGRNPRRQGGFAQLPQSLWEGGDTFGRRATRSDHLEWIHQPLQIDIGEESSQRWWLYVRMAYQVYPPPWARCFVKSLEDAAWDIVFRPTRLIHRPSQERSSAGERLGWTAEPERAV